MSENELSGNESIDARDARALTEPMTVCGQLGRARGADDLYLVVSTSEYLVDVREGVCECPDHQYRDANCKHLRRVTYEAGMRPIPVWADRDALDDQLLAAEHVDGEPVFTIDLEDDVDADADVTEPAIAPKATPGGRAIADGGCERPADCSCVAPSERTDGRELPCFPCYNAGFKTPNPEVAE